MQQLASTGGKLMLTENGHISGMLTDASAVRALIEDRGQGGAAQEQ
jgi:hypothetical protein